ncbi:hypothetical protein ACTG9Q_19830 [Actinokineospora sp. 24-640]
MRAKVLLAPVTVTPTKPLTPSHVKGLLWVDVMYRATGLCADVDYQYSLTTYNATSQTLGFWEYLDREHPDLDYADVAESDIGALYVRYQAEDTRAEFAALRPYLRAVESSGWVHPASARLVALWREHYASLGMHDPGLAEFRPPPLEQEDVLDRLRGRGLCLDSRDGGGAVYLDCTRFGLPLRQIATPAAQPNYLLLALRELVPQAERYDEIVLIHDRELTEDYVLLQRTLDALGASTVRVALDRVPIDGVVKSSRHGGWESATLPAILAECPADDPAVLRLGLRMYFLAVLGKDRTQSFRVDLLRATLKRAGKLLAGAPPRLDPVDLAAFVGGHRGDNRHVDPYRLTSGLLAKHRRPPVRDVAEAVYC